MTHRILLVDDDAGIRAAIPLLLADHGYNVQVADGGAEALKRLRSETFRIVLSDVAMPGMTGLELLDAIHGEFPEVPVIMISAHGDVATAVGAVRSGAYDYLLKPVDEDRLVHTLERALELSQLRSDYTSVQEESRQSQALIGASTPMVALRQQIERAAPSDARILVLGENGTGKELVAKLIHEWSPRSERPFVKLNSAALPGELIESELFGHEPGAFTGAHKMKRGKFELAGQGTLFLDEIGDMSLETQSKMLRVLSSGEYERVGGHRSLQFQARLVTATNKDLPAAVAAGTFREDLYHRIAVIPLTVPTLRERGEDILVLAEHFLEEFCVNYGRTPPEFDSAARRLLLEYTWPGNVREIRNQMERISIMHVGERIDESSLRQYLGLKSGESLESSQPSASGASDGDSAGLADRWKAEKKEEERAWIQKTLEESGWNVSLAARRLGIDRASLHRKMKRMGINRPGKENP